MQKRIWGVVWIVGQGVTLGIAWAVQRGGASTDARLLSYAHPFVVVAVALVVVQVVAAVMRRVTVQKGALFAALMGSLWLGIRLLFSVPLTLAVLGMLLVLALGIVSSALGAVWCTETRPGNVVESFLDTCVYLSGLGGVTLALTAAMIAVF